MGLVPSSLRLLIRLHQKVGLQGPVLTLGNQDIWASYEGLKVLFQESGCSYSEVTATRHTSHLFMTQMQSVADDFVHARTFFGMMGITDYTDIDKYDRDKPMILHDLNLPIPIELHGKYNLIVDAGTIEHIFDVRQTMENIVHMCNRTGWVVHLTPASNFIDHGFYTFSPIFFYDYYRANGFDDFICYIWQVNPKDYLAPCPYFEYEYGMNLGELIDPRRAAHVFFAARKANDLAKLIIPIQGCYDPQSGPIRRQVAQKAFSMYESLGLMLLHPIFQPLHPLLRFIRNVFFPRYRLLRKI